MQASKNYELLCKRKIDLQCHTLIFFMSIGSFTHTWLGLLEAFSWYPCFFRTYPATLQRILKISLPRIFPWCNHAISKIAPSQIFCPVPSEFKIVGLDCSMVCFSLQTAHLSWWLCKVKLCSTNLIEILGPFDLPTLDEGFLNQPVPDFLASQT